MYPVRKLRLNIPVVKYFHLLVKKIEIMVHHIASRLNITGALCHVTTPVEVIVQCMSSHGIEVQLTLMNESRYRKKCTDKFNNLLPLIIKDSRRMARYVNNRVVFSNMDIVDKAMVFLIKTERLTLVEARNMFIQLPYGPINDSAPESLDCTILYRMVRQRGIVTTSEYTTEDLYRLLLADFNVPAKRLQDFMVDVVQTMNSTQLLTHFFGIMKQRTNDFTFPLSEMYHQYLTSRDDPLKDPLRLKLPGTDQEAILMAAKNYKIDISDSSYPLMEYAILFKSGPKDRSFPIDSELQNRVYRDEYSLRLDQRFNPRLPDEAYNTDDIKRMATEEGWSRGGGALSEDDKNPFEFLRLTFSKNTFFAYGKGPMSGITPLNTVLRIDLETVADQDPANMILYGSRDNVPELQAISWIELIQTFENYREFRNPLDSTQRRLFADHCVNKLIVLAKKPCIDKTISDRRKRLVMIIESIRTESEHRTRYLSSIKETLCHRDEWKIEFQTLLEALYRMSLTMRSLRETDHLPEDGGSGTLTPEETQEAVALTAVGLDQLLHKVDPWVKDTFINLPLVIYYPRENKFSTGESTFEGHTIGGRLNIVHSGENTTVVSSCLRLSSNWFLSSICFYQLTLGFPTRFDISRLRHIA